jgi:uncharacterized protein YqhQ
VALEEEDTKLSGWATWGTILVALAFAVGVFFMLPLVVTNQLKEHLQDNIVFNLVEGVIRVIMFIIYLLAISRMKDIRRVFAYHGAEHKAINAYEAGAPLDVEHTRKYTTANPRCGTSFLFAVLVIAIIVFSLVAPLVKSSFGYMALSRILLLPVIAALGYEFIYFTSRHCSNIIIRAISTPGLWLQSLTTREPDDSQLEVGLASLLKVLQVEQPELFPAPQPAAEQVSQVPQVPVE